MQSAISKLQKFKDLNLHELLKNSDGNISEISQKNFVTYER